MSTSNFPSVVIVTGPTASGKSALALQLAERIGGEIVNADSVQFYRGFDIGSAKPAAEEQLRVPHHLFSIVSGVERFDAGVFVERAHEVIGEIHQRGAVPVVAGGTGLYLSALLNGLAEIPRSKGEDDRAALELAQLESEGPIASLQGDERARALHAVLSERDPVIAARIHPHDSQRIRRALQVAAESGDTLSALQASHRFEDRRYRALVFVVLPERQAVYRRIEERVDEMMAGGFLEEVSLLREQLDDSVKPLRSLGYRQLAQHLREELTLDEAVEAIKLETRHFAKRQYTWWRHQPTRLGWIEVEKQALAETEHGDRGPVSISNVESALRYTREFLSCNQPFSDAGVYYLHLDRFGFE